MSSQYSTESKASRCIDKRVSSMEQGCYTDWQTDPWLKISFSTITKVKRVQIFNRKDCCSERLAGAEVTLWSEGGQIKSCGTITFSSFQSQSYLINCGSNQLADTVQILLPGDRKLLNLHEVLVLTETPPVGAASCLLAKTNELFCTLPSVGLEDGDAITVLFFSLYWQYTDPCNSPC